MQGRYRTLAQIAPRYGLVLAELRHRTAYLRARLGQTVESTRFVSEPRPPGSGCDEVRLVLSLRPQVDGGRKAYLFLRRPIFDDNLAIFDAHVVHFFETFGNARVEDGKSRRDF